MKRSVDVDDQIKVLFSVADHRLFFGGKCFPLPSVLDIENNSTH